MAVRVPSTMDHQAMGSNRSGSCGYVIGSRKGLANSWTRMLRNERCDELTCLGTGAIGESTGWRATGPCVPQLIDAYERHGHATAGVIPVTFLHRIPMLDPWRHLGADEGRLSCFAAHEVVQRGELSRRLVCVSHADHGILATVHDEHR